MCRLRLLLCLWVPLAIAPGAPQAPGHAAHPIQEPGLVKALETGGISSDELVALIRERGVDFIVTREVEAELRRAGASRDVIKAARMNFRGTVPEDRPGNANRTGAQAATALGQVKRLYIEPMQGNLDQYIRAEIAKQMPGRLVVVLDKSNADAIMTGVAEEKKGTAGLHDTATGAVSIVDKAGKAVLWSSEAGDRTLLLGAFKHGGQPKVAERLVRSLKKATQ